MHLNADVDADVRFYALGEYQDTWRQAADGSWRLTERIKTDRGYAALSTSSCRRTRRTELARLINLLRHTAGQV